MMVKRLPLLADPVRAWVRGRLAGGEKERLLLVAGNRRALAGQLRQAFEGSARIVSASVPTATGVARPDDVVGPGLSALGAAVALVVPVMAPLVEAVKVGKQVVDVGRKLSARRDTAEAVSPAEFLVKLLTALGDADPTVVLIEDVGRDEDLWEIVSYIARHEPAALRGVALVATVEGPERLYGADLVPVTDVWDGVVSRAVESCRRGDAKWLYLPPLTVDRAQDWLGPLEGSLLELLIFMSGGDDDAAGELWAEWTAEGYVHLGEAGWRAVPGAKEPIGHWVFQVLQARARGQMSRTRTALDIAALFGVEYSETVVARAAAEELGVECSEVVDLLDALTPDGDQRWLVEPVSYVHHDDGDHWRYRMASPLLARYLQVSADHSVLSMLPRLFDEAWAVHGDDADYLDDLARLARRSGRVAQARVLNARIATRARMSQLRAHGLALLAITEQLPADGALLADAGKTTRNLYSMDLDSELAADLGERTVALARRQNLLIPWSLTIAGQAAANAGRGLGLLDEALTEWRGLYERDPTPEHCRDLAGTLTNLGWQLAAGPDPARGLGLLDEALTEWRGLYERDPTPEHRRELAATLNNLGWQLAAGADPARGLGLLDEALTEWRGLYERDPTPKHRRDLAGTLTNLGRWLAAGADPARGLGLLDEALTHERGLYERDPTPEHRRDLAGTLANLGGRLAAGADPARGLGLLDEALTHERGLYERDPTPEHRRRLAATLTNLGGRLAAGADPARGLGLLDEALTHERGLYERDPTPQHRRDLAATLTNLGTWLAAGPDPTRGRELLNEAQELRKA